jgi:hypothetical protein
MTLSADAFAIPDRIAVDAKGYGWRVWDGSDFWSMVPTNPDNSAIPQPVTWFVPEAEVERLRGLLAACRDWFDNPEGAPSSSDLLDRINEALR